MSTADRGKKLEAEFKAACSTYQAQVNFAFHRFPDAHAGSRVPTLADYQTCYKGVLRLVELKETTNDARLPYGNFKPDQVARMRLWAMAGAESWVIVKHTKTGTYRALQVQNFIKREEGRGSWDLQGLCPVTFSSISDVVKYIHNM